MIKLHKELTPVRIAITGGLRSGKSTLASTIRENLAGSRVFSFGDQLKFYFNEIFPNENGAKDRDGLVKFGQSCVDIDKYVWVKHLAQEVDSPFFYGGMTSGIIIDDLRQPHEYEFLRDNGFEIVRIEADADTRSERAKNEGDNFTSDSLTHPIEKYHETFDVDFTLNGNASPEEVFAEFMCKTKMISGKVTSDA